MKTYLTVPHALKKYGLTENKLNELIADGQVTAYQLNDLDDTTQTIVYDDDLAALLADQMITPDMFSELRGNFLSMNEASRKYGLNLGIISHWAKIGFLKYKADKNKKLIDEADIAYMVRISEAKKMRPGKKIFSRAS